MRNFILLLVACAALCVACNDKEHNDIKPSVVVLSNTAIAFPIEGGSGTIQYRINHRSEGLELEVYSEAEWITDISVAEQISFNVEANDEGKSRSANITLSYGKESTYVIVNQNGDTANVEFTARRFEGSYYGKEFSSAYNYFVVISDAGLKKDSNPKASGTYYYFDFYAETAADGDPILPNGTYTFDLNNTFAAGTISDQSSYYCTLDDNGNYDKVAYYSLATVTISDNRFDALITMTNGDVHHVVYEGDLLVEASSVITTLIRDTQFSVNGASIEIVNYGDLYDNGMNNIYIAVTSPSEGGKSDFFGFDLLVDPTTTIPSGRYEVAPEVFNEPGIFIPGMLNDKNQMVGTWYYTAKNGAFTGDRYAPMVGGYIDIETNSNNIMTITLNLVDDGRNQITGSVQGLYQIVEPEE